MRVHIPPYSPSFADWQRQVAQTLNKTLNEAPYSSGDFATLPTATSPNEWYWEFNNPDGAGPIQLKCSIPSTVSMAGGGGVQGVGLIFNGSTSAQTPNSGLAETNMIRMVYSVNSDAGQNLQCHLVNGTLTCAHNVGSSGNEGAVFLGTMRVTGPAAGGSNRAIGVWGADVHVEKAAGVATGKMVGLEVGVHSDVTQTYGDSTQRQNGIELWSGARDIAVTGVRAHDALTIFGAGGWTNFLNFLDTDGSALFKVDQTGSLSNAGNIDLRTGKAFKVNGTQVVAARDTGWTAMTGSPDRATAYATGSVTLAQLAGRVAQIQASLTTHGLIGA